MSFGFTPNYSQDLGLDGLTPAQFLAACVTTIRSLDWDIHYVSDSGLIALTSKGMFKRKQQVSVRIENDIATLKSESMGSEMMDWGRNRKNIELFIARIAEIRNSVLPEQLDQTYEELKPRLVPRENDVLSNPPTTTKQQWGDFLSLFVPRKGYFITPLLVDINIAVFMLMAHSGASPFSPDIQTLLNWGANVRSLTLDGQWWRIITCCFVHIGIFHLLLNMYALLYIGVLLEPQLGRGRFATAYLLTGIMASVASLYWHENTVSAGASGAIFGMYGVFLALLTTSLIKKTSRNALLISIGIFVGYNLLYGMRGGVDNAAHVGGLVSGMIIGYLYYPGLRKPGRPALLYSTIAVAILLVVATSILAFEKIPNDYGVYERKMHSFAGYEKKALDVVRHLTNDTSRNAQFHAINDSGIFYWDQCLRVLDEASRLNIPMQAKKRTDALIRYCNLRIQSYRYFAGSIAGSPAINDSMTYYNTEITKLTDSLKNAHR